MLSSSILTKAYNGSIFNAIKSFFSGGEDELQLGDWEGIFLGAEGMGRELCLEGGKDQDYM